MMDFYSFAAAHGLIIKSLEVGRWARVPTVDHPRKRNGAYFFDRDYGFVQNWAEMPEPVLWQDRIERTPFDQAALAARMEASRRAQADERRKLAKQAADKAQHIIRNAKQEPHAYLDSKGWRDALGLVYYPDENTNLLVIPMRHQGEVVGCQLIDRDGQKRFLRGQRTNDCEFVFGRAGVHIYAEGYATARSISESLSACGVRAIVHACFSAGNLTRMAKSGFVVADKDASETGEKAAQATGLPYWLPQVVGEDFNDVWRRGSFAAGMELRKFLQHARNGVRPEPGARETNPVRG